MGCLQSKPGPLAAPEAYLKSRGSPEISVSQSNSRTGSLLSDPETGVSPRAKSWTTYGFPEAWHRSQDGSIETRFMRLRNEKGETVMRVGRRGPSFDPLYHLMLDDGDFAEVQDQDKTQVRTPDGTLRACVAFHMCVDIDIHESFSAKGIDGPGYVVYGTTPHFKGQPPTENYNGVVPLYAWAKLCASTSGKGGKHDVAVYTAEGHFFNATPSFVVKMCGEGRAAVEECGTDGEHGEKPGVMLVRDGHEWVHDSAHGSMEGDSAREYAEEEEGGEDDDKPRGHGQSFVLAGGADVAFFVCAYIGAAKFNLFRNLAVRK